MIFIQFRDIDKIALLKSYYCNKDYNLKIYQKYKNYKNKLTTLIYAGVFNNM